MEIVIIIFNLIICLRFFIDSICIFQFSVPFDINTSKRSEIVFLQRLCCMGSVIKRDFLY